MSGRQHAVAKEADIVGSDWYASGISGISDSFRSFFFSFLFFSHLFIPLLFIFYTFRGSKCVFPYYNTFVMCDERVCAFGYWQLPLLVS